VRPEADPGRTVQAAAGLTVVLMLSLAACSSPSPSAAPAGHEAATSQSNPPTAGSASRPKTYRVVASVLHTRRMDQPFACNAILLSLPPAGCSGVPVTGFDLEHIKGVRRAGGTWWTPVLRLIGTWYGHVLTLTRPPVIRRSPGRDPSPPASCVGPASPFIKTLARKVTREHARIDMLALQPCAKRVWILVAAADHRTISYLHHRFGDHFLVTGWLQPLER
jgi:hypothetical protein